MYGSEDLLFLLCPVSELIDQTGNGRILANFCVWRLRCSRASSAFEGFDDDEWTLGINGGNFLLSRRR
jgi:hypothetical protein